MLAPAGEEDRQAGEAGLGARSPNMAGLEATLFLAQEPMGSRKIAQLANLADGTQARTLVGLLNRMYDAEGRAFRVVEVAGGFQLMTRPKFAPWLRRLHASQVEVRLSPPAMETLAVVAYRQPVLRVEIEAVRGVQCGEILRQLMERDLVRIAGRSDDLGRPFLYGTTRRFLQVFGLRHLDELPRTEFARAVGLSTQQPQSPGGRVADPESESTPHTSLSLTTEEESNVKTRLEMTLLPEEMHDEAVATALAEVRGLASREDDDEDLEDEDEDEEDDLDEEEEEDVGDDGIEDEEWEEVPEEDEEDEDWDEEDEDWEDEEEDDEDWDDDDEDWDDEEEEEEWEEEE